MSYCAFLRPDARSGESLVLNSSNGWIPSFSGAAAAWRSYALDCPTTCRSQIRASASAVRGGCRWISTSCSYVPLVPNGTRYTVFGKIDHHSAGSPSTDSS